MPVGFIAPKTLNYLAFQSFDFETRSFVNKAKEGGYVRIKDKLTNAG
jgi:hypothetical protein